MAGASRRIRVYMWHINRMGHDLFFSLRAMLDTPTTAAVSLMKIQDGTGLYTDVSSTANCIAASQLFAEMDVLTQSIQPIIATESTVLCPFFARDSGAQTNYSGVFAVMEFTVLPVTNCSLMLRTVGSAKLGSWGNSTDTPYPPTLGDGRGWWPYSKIDVNAGPLLVMDLNGTARSPDYDMVNGIESRQDQHVQNFQ